MSKYGNTEPEARTSVREMTDERRQYYEEKVINGVEWRDAENRGLIASKIHKKELLI